MEKPTAFDLNEAVRLWRDRLSRLPSFRTENVDELEAHLRDSVRRLHASGLSEEEAWFIAQKRLGYNESLEREFAKINVPIRTARAITSMMISILVGSVLLQTNHLLELVWAWGGLNKWPIYMLAVTGLTIPTFLLLVLPLFALLRTLNWELSWPTAAATGFLLGSSIVALLQVNFPGHDLQMMLRTVLIGGVAGAVGVALHARFKLTPVTEHMVKGAWTAMIGACVCGLGLQLYLVIAYAWPYTIVLEKGFRLIFMPLYFALLSSWFVFPVGALLGAWLSVRVRRLSPRHSLGFGFMIGAAVGTLAALIYMVTTGARLGAQGIFGQRLRWWEMDAQASAQLLPIVIIPVCVLWVGLWAWVWNRRLNANLPTQSTTRTISPA